MYLHLGRDVSVPQDDIIGVFDLDTTSYSKRSREFLRNAQNAGAVINISDDLPKAFVLCAPHRTARSRRSGKRGKSRVYISQISSATLLKRVESGPIPENIL